MTVTTTTPADTGDEFEDDDVQEDDDQNDNQDGGGGDGRGKGTKVRVQVKDGKVLVDGEEFDAERALDTIASQRQSETDLKAKLKSANAKVKELTNKDKPVDEQTKERLAELEEENSTLGKKLQKQAVKSAAIEAAQELKFRNPAIAYKLIDPDDIQWDDDEPTNLVQLLKREAKANSYLIRRGRATEDDGGEDDDDGADGGKGRGSRSAGGAGDMNAQIRAAAGH